MRNFNDGKQQKGHESCPCQSREEFQLRAVIRGRNHEAGTRSWTFTPNEGFGHGAVGSLQTLGEPLNFLLKPSMSDHTSLQNSGV